MVEYIDTHAHNSDEAFAECEDEIISKNIEDGVSMILKQNID